MTTLAISTDGYLDGPLCTTTRGYYCPVTVIANKPGGDSGFWDVHSGASGEGVSFNNETTTIPGSNIGNHSTGTSGENSGFYGPSENAPGEGWGSPNE